MALSQEQIDALEAQFKKIIHVHDDDVGDVVFRKPTRGEYKLFRAMSNDPGRKSEAGEALLTTCVVYPSQAAFEALLEDFPALCDGQAVSAALLKMIGASAEVQKK